MHERPLQPSGKCWCALLGTGPPLRCAAAHLADDMLWTRQMGEPPSEPNRTGPFSKPDQRKILGRLRLGWVVWTVLACVVLMWGVLSAYRSPLTRTPDVGPSAGIVSLERGSAKLVVTVFDSGEVEPPDAGNGADAAGATAVAPPPQPLEGAQIAVFVAGDEETWVETARGTADASGRVALERLPSGVAWLLVRAPGHARDSRHLVLYDEQELTVNLTRSNQLAVMVEDEEGTPLRQATVLVQGADELPFGRLTDEHGVARLSGVGNGPYTIQAFARGYSTAKRERITRDTRIVLARLGSLFVRTLGVDGDPVANADVQVVGTRLWPARRVTTDEKGRVFLAGLPEGLYDLRATRNQLVSPIISNFKLERGQQREVELQLLAGRMVDVSVRSSDEEQVPIPKARLVLAEHGLSAFPLTAVANDAGHALLGPLPPGPAFLSVRAEGFIGRGALPVPEEGPMSVKLLRGGTVRGEVVDVDDRPIRDARVEVVGLDLDGLPIAESPLSAAYREAHFDFAMRPLSLVPAGELGITHGPVPFVNMVTDNPEAEASDFSALPADYAPWSTNFEGRFRAFPVPPGRIRLIVRHHRYAEGQSRIFTMGPGGNVKVKVVLDEGNTLRGRVVNADDRPVASARVLVNGIQNGFERRAVVAGDGTFSMRGVPGEVHVSVARPSEPTRFVKRQRVVLNSSSNDEHEFVLPEARDALEWTVYDDLNKPLELAQVSIQSVDPDVPLRMTQFSDAQGRVVMEDAGGLRLRVTIEAPGFIPLTEQVDNAATRKDFSLVRGVKVTGRITGVRGRSAVAGAQVVLEGGTRRNSTVTSSLGEYEFANVAPGRLQLRVTHDSYANTLREIVVEPTGHVDRPFEVDDIDMQDAITVRGSVVDAQGRPVPAARVAPEPVPEFRPKNALGEHTVLTDDEGRFTLHGLAAGARTIYAQSAVAGRGQAPVTLREGDNAVDVQVRLDSSLDPDDVEFSRSAGSVALALRPGVSGLVIASVPANGEAERAGLRVGDVVSLIDGTQAAGLAAARNLLRGPVTSDVVVEVIREGAPLTFRVRREQVSK